MPRNRVSAASLFTTATFLGLFSYAGKSPPFPDDVSLKDIQDYVEASRNPDKPIRTKIDGTKNPNAISRIHRVMKMYGIPVEQLPKQLSEVDREVVRNGFERLSDEMNVMGMKYLGAQCAEVSEDRDSGSVSFDRIFAIEDEIYDAENAVANRHFDDLLSRLSPDGRTALKDLVDNKIARTMKPLIRTKEDRNLARRFPRVAVFLLRNKCSTMGVES